MTRYLFLLTLLLLPMAAVAQDVVATEHATFVGEGPRFFAALVAGVVLALAFQLILTTLSVATGLQLAGDHDDDDFVDLSGLERHSAEPLSDRIHDKTDKVAAAARKFSTAAGLWAIVTASIALFFATWLAVELSLTDDLTAGAVLGLVIWGLFYIIIMRLEMRAASSVVGHVNRWAHTGFRSARKLAGGAMRKTGEMGHSDTMHNIAERVREEVFGDVEAERLKGRLQQYVREFQLSSPARPRGHPERHAPHVARPPRRRGFPHPPPEERGSRVHQGIARVAARHRARGRRTHHQRDRACPG
jgi:hypothetical protein